MSAKLPNFKRLLGNLRLLIIPRGSTFPPQRNTSQRYRNQSLQRASKGNWLRRNCRQSTVGFLLAPAPFLVQNWATSPQRRAPLRPKFRFFQALVVVSLFALAPTIQAQNAAAGGPNSDPTYQQLRNIGLGSEAVSVKDFELKRDAATFHLHSGTVCFVTQVNGKVTGAVFVGDGNMVLDPPIPIERSSLKLLTKGDEFVEQYEHLVLRFTDSTYDEIKKAGTPGGSCDAGLLHD